MACCSTCSTHANADFLEVEFLKYPDEYDESQPPVATADSTKHVIPAYIPSNILISTHYNNKSDTGEVTKHSQDLTLQEQIRLLAQSSNATVRETYHIAHQHINSTGEFRLWIWD